MKHIITLLALCASICSQSHAADEQKPKPNFIIVFADDLGWADIGLKALAKHRLKEGILACVDYTTAQNPWASQKRTPELMKILLN